MIKYQYAKNREEELVSINSVNKNMCEKYFCISCQEELIPKIGKIRSRHFAHKNIKTVCSTETYLHVLGKIMFHDVYKKCIDNNEPFYIEVKQEKKCNCYEDILNKTCKWEVFENIDITKYFDKILYEKRIDGFIPDLCLSNEKKDMIFVEIAVTHKVTDKKETSKHRIIEIQIETEEDLQIITNRLFSQKNDKIKFINFKTKTITGNICDGNCDKMFHYLFLDKNGKVLLKQKNLKEISNLVSFNKNNLQAYHVEDIEYSDYGNIYKKFVAQCAIKNLNVRNCFICRYHALNEGYNLGSIFCKFLKKACASNEAVECEYFKKERKYMEEIMNKK